MTSMDTEKQPLLETQVENAAETPEPTLADLQQQVFKAQRAYMKAWSRTTSGKWHKRIIYGVTALLLLFAAFMLVIIIQDGLDDDYPTYHSSRVALEAHIMSKCPDAKDCLHDMILPAMVNVSNKVDFRLSYIGTPTDHDDGVECKHGQEECLGNMLELCAAHLYPDPKIYLGFTWCLTKEYSDIPKRDLVEDCALEHGISMQKLNECTVDEDGALSVDRLRASFNRSAEAGVTKSCTVRLNDEIRCIRDDGKWKECDGGATAEDLISDIMALYDARRLEWAA